MSDISRAAELDDLYVLVELSYRYKLQPEKLAEIAAALEASIPNVDPLMKRRELVRVVEAPPFPEFERARQMAREALADAG